MLASISYITGDSPQCLFLITHSLLNIQYFLVTKLPSQNRVR